MYDMVSLADIIVVSRALSTFMPANMARVAADVVVASGKPVVAVPEEGRGFAAAEAALIAWNGSAEASTAVIACVPLLQKALTVTILEIDDGRIEIPAEDAAAYLSRHGIHALLIRERKGATAVADLILRTAKRSGAAYIVMGGFGRAPTLETLFGGVSHDLLQSGPIPLVLVH